MTTLDPHRLLSDRAKAMNVSGIRRVLELGGTLTNPYNFSIGQPDFPVPDPIKHAAAAAIESDRNGYAISTGVPSLLARVADHLRWDLGWPMPPRGIHPAPPAPGDDSAPGLLITSGTSGAILLAMLALISPGDEVIIPEPYFVLYPDVVRMAGGVPVLCDCHPDFRMTAERVEPLITARTKAVLLNSPSNPAGTVLGSQDCTDLLSLCKDRGVLLISDEIYDEFTFDDFRTESAAGNPADFPHLPNTRCPSPARRPGAHDEVLLIRGFGKTYGVTGWRLGYAAGPAWLTSQMTKIQQFTFVCAPTPLQAGVAAALDIDMTELVAAYQARRDIVIDVLGDHCPNLKETATPGGAFYAYPELPEQCGSAAEFMERLVARNVLTIPGGVFCRRDTHLRISYACPPDRLRAGLELIADEIDSAGR